MGSFFRSKAPNNAIPHKRPQQLTKLKKDPQVVLTTEGDPPPSLPGSGKVPFQIKNQSDSHLQLIWIDKQGNHKTFRQIAKASTHTIPTHVGHTWLLKTKSGTTLGHLIIPKNGARLHIE